MPKTNNMIPQVLQINRVTGKQEKFYTVSYKQHQGARHMVVPVVIMVPGVHNGSHGPILHTEEELSRFVESWNGIPVLIGHPQVDGADVSANDPSLVDSSVIGRIYNAVYARGKLRAEAWLDESRLKSKNSGLVKHLKDGKPLEVSMGAFSDEEPAEGKWNGETYSAISHNYRPDHLALLPNAVGACSWNDGGGIRTNEQERKIRNGGGRSMDKAIFEGLLSSGYLIRQMPNDSIQTDQEGMGYRELVSMVQQKLNPLDNSDYSHYVEELYDSFVVYRVEGRGERMSSRLVKRDFNMTSDGTAVEFTGDPIPVVRKIQYMEQTIQGNEEDEEVSSVAAPVVTKFVRTKGVKMDKKKEEAVLTQQETVVETPTPVTPAIVVPKATPVANEAPQLNDDQLMALLSPEKRKAVEAGLAIHTAHRKEMTDYIVANSNGVYTEEDLLNQEDASIEKLMKVLKPETDYSLASGGTAPQGNADKGEAPLLPPGVKVIKK